MRGNPSTIWAQLATPHPASGSIPFVYSDNVTIVTNVGYFWFNPNTNQLSVYCPNDQTGTDSFNTYYNQDSYWPQANGITSGLTQNGTTAAHTVSSSRGTGINPQINNVGDFIGKFSGWSYTGSLPASAFYQEVAGVNIYLSGTTASAAGAGGELRFFTKQDNGPQVEWWRITNTGNYTPLVPAMSIGAISNGGLGNAPVTGTSLTVEGLYLSYNITLGTNNVTQNSLMGRAVIAAGQNTLTVNNTHCTINSFIFAVQSSNDATATGISNIIAANGYFTIKLNAFCTGNTTVTWMLMRTDS